MRFVPVKSPDEQAAGMVLKTRELLVRQRSQTANAMRAHMAELGIIAATGMTSIAKLIAILRDDRDGRLPNSARAALLEMADQIERLTERVEVLDSKIVVAVKADDAARRLTTIPGVGPIIAATVRTVVQDPAAFEGWIWPPGSVSRLERTPAEGKSGWARSRSAAVGDHHTRQAALPFQKLSHQALCRLGIARALHQHVENKPVLINGAPKPVLLSTDGDDNLIEESSCHLFRMALARCLPNFSAQSRTVW
ncbi:hypothetical protein GGE56_007694 [Rhizobium leguminosarum]|nr:hypothetical protein [Rhizobium leguminosarum]MBB6299331.1 hypothetical protein [Rhizobium leguminosarum]